MYGKIFSDIFDSTLMADGGMEAVYVFMSMVVLADQDGAVRIDGRVLSNRIGIPFSKLGPAIGLLLHPDSDSNLPDQEGKRIMPLAEVEHLEGSRGFWIVNYEHYRDKGTRAEIAAKATERKRRQRARDNGAKKRDVSRGSHVTSRMSHHTDTDTDTDKNNTCEHFEEFWQAWPKGRRVEKKKAKAVWEQKSLDEKAADILVDLNLRTTSPAWSDPKFIPHPHRYLSGERWNDEIDHNKGDRGFV